MSFPVLICDDSALARKQMARSLPATLNADITFAIHGKNALEELEKNEFKLMFLDLTMPEMDGFETLENMQRLGNKTPVVVVSGDIQPKAKERVFALGAKAFIQKPIAKDELKNALKELVEPEPRPQIITPVSIELPIIRRRDIYMEVANVSIGRAADALARHFDVFVQLPLPNVNIFEVSELHMALRDLASHDNVSAPPTTSPTEPTHRPCPGGCSGSSVTSCAVERAHPSSTPARRRPSRGPAMMPCSVWCAPGLGGFSPPSRTSRRRLERSRPSGSRSWGSGRRARTG